jgi:hypothetical protein
MNITLRKANAVQNSINDAIRSIKIETSIELNEFQDVTAELQAANDLLLNNDARRQKLLLALYNIRGLVGTANANSGIDLALAKAAFIDKRISQLNELAESKAVTNIAVLNGKLDKIRNRKEDSYYGRNEEVSTSIFTSQEIDNFKNVLAVSKKQKQKLQDELLELNVRTEITLSEQTVATLTKENIL